METETGLVAIDLDAQLDAPSPRATCLRFVVENLNSKEDQFIRVKPLGSTEEALKVRDSVPVHE